MSQFIVKGGVPLRGTVSIGGSKNAALPILAATLLTDELCILRNVPHIRDTYTMLSILQSMGSEIEFKNHTVRIQTKKIRLNDISGELACTMRASVLLFGSLLARLGKARLPYPGGCVLGARPIDTHINIFEQMGVREIRGSDEEIVLEGTPRAAEIVMPEMSVTATENAVMAAARARGVTTIHLAALEPHIQDLCHFINALGGEVSGIGTHTLRIRGVKKLHGASHTVIADYLEAGSFIAAAAATGGDVVVKNVPIHDLDAYFNLLRGIGVPFAIKKNTVHIMPAKKLVACKRLQTNVFPGFPTDLQPPFVVLLTQAHGTSYIHEALFEGRFAYFPELKKMGAKLTVKNAHEAYVQGHTRLRGGIVRSCDIRAGAAMIVAALTAEGTTTINDIKYIDRGYEDFDGKLRALGARIQRVETDTVPAFVKL